MIVYWVLRTCLLLGRALPSRVAERMATLIGLFVYLALPGKRANMKRNLRVMLGAHAVENGSPATERRIGVLARRSMVAYVLSLLDFFRWPLLLPHVYRDTQDTPGWEHVDRLLAAGRGAVFATAHFGHWDLAGAAMAHHCPPGTVYAVTESFTNPRVDALVTAERALYGLEAVPMDDVRRMVRVLREGKVLGVLIDRPVDQDEGVVVRFFGHETRIPAGVATLALLARVPILAGFLRQRADGRFEGTILPPIEPIRTGNRTADIQQTMQRVVDDLERVIRRSPHQWYMFRAMWPGVAPAAPRRLALARSLATSILPLLRRDA
ncbi:MAG TPA: lysophospholipid acyltransferase family protein [Chloroflexota bacterium]|nr:lysophospholipid acyltransferase family protein [Chloroflexota bacterium]